MCGCCLAFLIRALGALPLNARVSPGMLGFPSLTLAAKKYVTDFTQQPRSSSPGLHMAAYDHLEE